MKRFGLSWEDKQSHKWRDKISWESFSQRRNKIKVVPQKIAILRHAIFPQFGPCWWSVHFFAAQHNFCITFAQVPYALHTYWIVVVTTSLRELGCGMTSVIGWLVVGCHCHEGGLWTRPIVNYYRTLIGTHFDHLLCSSKASSMHLALFMYVTNENHHFGTIFVKV